jgi:hypothetical protein
MLKAITLYEPYASLMAIGAKRNETRGCRTSLRGDIAIHAAKKDYGCSEAVGYAAVKAFRDRGLEPSPDTLGCLVAVVNLYDVQPAERVYPTSSAEELAFGNYLCGRWIYLTHTVRRLAKPVPCRGYQSIGWTVPPDVEAKVREQLPKVITLECCCCGQPAPAFKQWWNRDTGYGICATCYRRITAKEGCVEALQRYGHPGVHHSL